LDVSPGDVCGVIGPNGAGKTTLFNLLTGALPPTAGWVEFGGRRLDSLGPADICRLGLARTFQTPRPFGRLSVHENVLVAALAASRPGPSARLVAREALQAASLWGLRDHQARSLTLAARKRLELARALAARPRLLLLDEIAAGLNPTETEEALGTIAAVRDSGVTLILVEHVMKVVLKLSTRLVVLNHGRKLAEGRPDRVIQDPQVLLAYLGRTGPEAGAERSGLSEQP
jgi:branched-chain amino acid transport system ATP-binding protein